MAAHEAKKKSKDFTYVVLIPAKNEERTIGDVIREAKAVVPAVIVVNDHSTDNTAKNAEGAGAIVVPNEGKTGKGSAVKSGFLYILKNTPCDAIITMDGDGQHDPAEISIFIKAFEESGADIIIGERKNFHGLSWYRKVWNRSITLLLSLHVGYVYRDTQCGFRLFRREMLEELVPECSGYEIEAEHLIKACLRGFLVRRAAVSSPRHFSKEDAGELKHGIIRAGRILWSVFAFSSLEFWRLLKRNNGKIIAALIVALAVFHTAQLLYRGDASFYFRGYGDAYGRETHAAMEWLKSHSNPEDVVLAHWQFGHQVVAYAGRPVIATSKVYPSEALEVGKRHVDIARFFFATGENAAKKISDKYGARFVVLQKDFQATLCWAIRACSFTADGKLTAYGKKETMAGKMARGAEFKSFKPVFNSKNIIIYKVSDSSGLLSQSERRALFLLTRKTLSAYLTGEKPVEFQKGSSVQPRIRPARINLTLWIDGAIRASQIMEAATLEQAIIQAVPEAIDNNRLYSLSQKDLSKTRIEITVLGDDFAPIDPGKEARAGLARANPEFGYRVRGKDGSFFYLISETLNTERLDSAYDFFSILCKKAGYDSGCYLDQKLEFETFSSENFIEDGKDGVFELAGASPAASPAFSRGTLLDSMIRAADWKLTRQDESGKYQMITSPFGRKNEEWSINRDAIAATTLVNLWKITKDEKYLASAVRNAAYINGLVKQGTHFVGISNAGFIALENMALFDALGDKQYLQNAYDMLAKGISQNITGSSTAALSHFGYALASYAQMTKAPNMRAWAELAGIELMKRFKKDYILETGDRSTGMYGWMANVGAVLFDVTGKKEYGEFALTAADLIVQRQNSEGKSSTLGAFPNTSDEAYVYVRGTGKAGEGLADALRISVRLGRNPAHYKKSLEEGLSWIMKMQYDEANAFFIPTELLPDFLGGFRHDHFNPDAWIDAASHFMIGGIKYINATK